MSCFSLIKMTPTAGVHGCTRAGRVQRLSLSVCSQFNPPLSVFASPSDKLRLQRQSEFHRSSAYPASTQPLRSSMRLGRHFMRHEAKSVMGCRGIYVGCRSGLRVAGQRKLHAVGSQSCNLKVGNHRWKVGRSLAPRPWGRCSVPKVASGVRASSDYVRVSSTLETDIPFPELYGVSLEQYMTETQRIFSAVFPDTHRAQRVSSEVWRIFMLPINFFFLSVRPVVDMRVWVHDPSVDGPRPGATATGGKAKKMVCLEALRCDLRGLDYVLKPDDFILGANGALYPERTGPAARLRGSMHVSISLAVPPALIFTPKGLLEPAGNAVMEQLLQNMKNKVNSQLLVDYRAYAREEAAKRQQIQSD